MSVYEIVSVVFKILTLPVLFWLIYYLGRALSFLESSAEADKNKNENKE